MRQAISYSRFSAARQAEGDSIRRQAAGFKRFCEQFELVPHVENFVDKGKSGFHGKHRQGDFGRMLDRIKEFKGCVLVIEDMDRFSRECPIDALNTLQEICRAGVDVGITSENKIFTLADLSDTGNLLRIVIRASIAHEESAKKSGRLLEKSAAKRKEMKTGKRFGGICPAWLQWNEITQQFEFIPETMKTFQGIIQDVINGQGAYVIATRLNKAGIKRIGRKKYMSIVVPTALSR